MTGKASPRTVCVCCQVNEVPWYELTCDACRPTLQVAGLLDAPQPNNAPTDQRTQIGPTEI